MSVQPPQEPAKLEHDSNGGYVIWMGNSGSPMSSDEPAAACFQELGLHVGQH